MLKLMTRADMVRLQRVSADRPRKESAAPERRTREANDAKERAADVLKRFPKIMARLAE